MKIKQILSILCAAAVISVSACQASEVHEGGGSGASTTETSSPADTTTVSEANSSASDTTTTTVSSAETDDTTTTAVTTVVTTSEPSETTKAVSSAKENTTTSDLPAPTPSDEAPSSDEIDMKIESDGDITPDSNFTLTMKFIGDDDTVCYWLGAEYRIDRYEDGKWREFPFSDDAAWIAIAYELSYRSNAVFGISLKPDMYKEPVTAGKYRVVKTIMGEEYYAEFEIKDKEDKIEYVQEKGSAELYISEIKADEYICYNIYPLPGTYHVKCNTSDYEDFCVGDQIEVTYSRIGYDPSGADGSDVILVPDNISPTNVTLNPDVCYKPVIYLYPEKKTDVSVSVDFNGRLTITDPEYSDGWNVTACPDGTLIHEGREYPYLFWEGDKNFELDTSEGFCVSGEETEKFLIEKIAYLGLNEKETDEFMEFWLPFMKNNNYNVITFAGADYADNAKLDISPAPDTVIRVFMVFRASDEFVDIEAQELEEAPARNGFTVVEWGGSVEK